MGERRRVKLTCGDYKLEVSGYPHEEARKICSDFAKDVEHQNHEKGNEKKKFNELQETKISTLDEKDQKLLRLLLNKGTLNQAGIIKEMFDDFKQTTLHRHLRKLKDLKLVTYKEGKPKWVKLHPEFLKLGK